MGIKIYSVNPATVEVKREREKKRSIKTFTFFSADVTSVAAEEDGESKIFLFFLGPMAARAVRLASLCLI